MRRCAACGRAVRGRRRQSAPATRIAAMPALEAARPRLRPAGSRQRYVGGRWSLPASLAREKSRLLAGKPYFTNLTTSLRRLYVEIGATVVILMRASGYDGFAPRIRRFAGWGTGQTRSGTRRRSECPISLLKYPIRKYTRFVKCAYP